MNKIKEIINNCHGECARELYLCSWYHDCEQLKKIANKLNISELPYTWNEEEISLISEHYDCGG